MIFRGRLTGLKQFHANNDGIKFKFAVATDQGEMEVFSDSYTTGKDDDSSRIVAGMTRRRLKILGLDVEVCGADEWVTAMAPGEDGWSHVLDGAECDLEQKTDSYGTKYDILTTQAVDKNGSLAMFAALQAAKGPRPQVTPPPAAPARPSMAAPAPPRVPRPLQTAQSPRPAPVGQTPSPAPSTPVQQQSSII